MAASALQVGVWEGTPLTKFRVPRVRRDVIERASLLARLSEAVDSHPVTIVMSPGGYGKSTLLAQYAGHAKPEEGRVVVWLAIDEDDNDVHRLFATLLRSVEALELAWETEPRALLANASGSASQQRAAVAALVNALCTSSAKRIALVLDDFHRVASEPALVMMEAFVERLPDHVSLVFGTRKEPGLPLARWRVHGEVAEFRPSDLEFSESEAASLAVARLGHVAESRLVREAMRRTHGWAAGLSMVLQSKLADAGVTAESSESRDRHLFAYLAQEVLADLPDDCQEFLCQSSVLAELNPMMCMAVTGRADSAAVLDRLYKRSLFITAIDEATPVLRFHDLFRDFLQGELRRRYPNTAVELHRRAARAETAPTRAIAHYIEAEAWDEAIGEIVRVGETVLMEGGHATVQRWIDALPSGARVRNPIVGYLRGICAWLRWDWPRAKEEFGAVVYKLDPEQQGRQRLRCLFMYIDALNSSGEAEQAGKVLEEIAHEPLPDIARAQLALQRAWHAMPDGEPEKVGQFHAEFVAEAEKSPDRVCPATADLIHCLCIGLPGVARAFDRYYALSEQVRRNARFPWKFAALAVGLWGHFWYGRRDRVEQLLRESEVLQQQFGTIRLVAERLVQFKAQYLGAIGQHAGGVAVTKAVIAALDTPEAAGHRAAWGRAYLHGLERQYWLAMDANLHAELLPQLIGARRPAEWPFIDAATETARGHAAILIKDWRSAQSILTSAVRLHARYRMPMTYADPRIALAYAQLMSGDKTAAANTFAPVYAEVIDDQAIGLLLLEPRAVVQPLLENVNAESRRSPQHQSLLRQLDTWQGGSTPQVTPANTGPLISLSERELEVLAQVAAGASNKHIARDLSLSLHTVKRHIANILDKLDCASRGQAADLYRRSAR